MSPIEVFWDSLDQPIRVGSYLLAFSWASIILEVVLPLLGLLLAFWLAIRWTKSLISKTSLGDDRKVNLLRGIKIGVRVVYVLIALLLLSRLWEDRIVQFIDDVIKAIGSPFYTSGNTRISLVTLILAIPVIFIANIAGRASRIAFERSKVFTHNLDESRRVSIANLLRYAVMVIALIFGLSIIGIDLSAINMILLVVFIGVIAGLYQTLSSFFAGVVLVLNRPIKEGDLIRLEGHDHESQVKHIKMLTSVIEDSYGETTIIPNSQLLHRSIKNLSMHENAVMLRVPLTIEYNEDAENARKILVSTAARCPLASLVEEPRASIVGFGLYGLELELVLRLNTIQDKPGASAWIHQEVYKEFRTAGIKFASAARK